MDTKHEVLSGSPARLLQAPRLHDELAKQLASCREQLDELEGIFRDTSAQHSRERDDLQACIDALASAVATFEKDMPRAMPSAAVSG